MLAQPLDEPVRAVLGAHEHEPAPAVGVLAQLAHERVELGVVGDGHEAVADVRLALGLGRELVAARVGRVRVGDLAGGAVERGAEEERLALARRALHDAVDRGPEAHVEHAVGLVEDQGRDLVELHGASLEQVLEPAGRRDQDVGALGELGLALDAGAAVDGRDRERAGVRDRAQLLDDLTGQLARRHEHECGGARVGGLDAVDERHAEGERLARAGGRLDEHVAPGEHVGDDERLHGEGLFDPSLGEGGDHGARGAEVGEGTARHRCGSLLANRVLRRPVCDTGDSTDPDRRSARDKNLASGGAACPPEASSAALSRCGQVTTKNFMNGSLVLQVALKPSLNDARYPSCNQSVEPSGSVSSAAPSIT